MINLTHDWNTSLKPLIWGLIISVVLTFVTYWLFEMGSSNALCFAIIVLGSVQALIQLYLFMHLGLEGTPQQGLMLFIFMIFIMTLIVGGSVWIMTNLGYNIMPSAQMPG